MTTNKMQLTHLAATVRHTKMEYEICASRARNAASHGASTPELREMYILVDFWWIKYLEAKKQLQDYEKTIKGKL